MPEQHPFLNLHAPGNINHLIVGTFPCTVNGQNPQWFYGSTKNYFWRIMQAIFDHPFFGLVETQVEWARANHLWFSDIYLEVTRNNGNCSDSNLIVNEYNIEQINDYLALNTIQCVYFTSELAHQETINQTEINNYNIHTVLLFSPSPNFSRSLGRKQEYKNWKVANPALNTFHYRVLNYRKHFLEQGLLLNKR